MTLPATIAKKGPYGQRLRETQEEKRERRPTRQTYPEKDLPQMQHLAGKKLFCKLDCSQAYHCLPMADQRSIEMLAFNFASRTFAYRRLAQGLSRALSAFSSFMSEYLDKSIKADQCAQYVDDISIAANDADHLIANLRATFNCIEEAGLKLTMHKCNFGAKKLVFSDEQLPHKALNPKNSIYKTFWKNQIPEVEKGFTTLFGILELLQKLCPKTFRTPRSILQNAQI